MRATHGRIWEAASTEPSRPILTCVYFDAANATLTATDSYIAARVPCEVEDGDESGLIPAAALKTAFGRRLRKGEARPSLRVGGGEATLERWSRDGTYQEKLVWKLLTGPFPKIDEILERTAVPIDAPFGVNTAFLDRLARAIGCHAAGNNAAAALHPVSPLRAIRVHAHGAEGAAFGAIMPIRLRGAAALVEQSTPQPDFSNPDVIAAGARAAVAALDKRRGKKRAAEAFMDAARDATIAASEPAKTERKAA